MAIMQQVDGRFQASNIEREASAVVQTSRSLRGGSLMQGLPPFWLAQMEKADRDFIINVIG